MPVTVIPVETNTHTTKLDYVGSDLTYVGNAVAGSSSASAVWRIKKLFYDSGKLVNVYYADGDTEFNNVWDNRASLSYS